MGQIPGRRGVSGGGLCRDPGTRGRADGGEGRAPHLQAKGGEGVERCCYSSGYALSSINPGARY